jgi:hypothetical protein
MRVIHRIQYIDLLRLWGAGREIFTFSFEHDDHFISWMLK